MRNPLKVSLKYTFITIQIRKDNTFQDPCQISAHYSIISIIRWVFTIENYQKNCSHGITLLRKKYFVFSSFIIILSVWFNQICIWFQGHDTTASTTGFTIFALANHPEFQVRKWKIHIYTAKTKWICSQFR